MAGTRTETPHPQARDSHLLAVEPRLALMLAAQKDALNAVDSNLSAIAAAADMAAQALRRRGGKFGYVGAGSSGLMAVADCLELLGTFGIPASQTPMLFAGGAAALLEMAGSVEDDDAAAAADFRKADFTAGDCLIVISASGSTPYALHVAEAARAAGVKVVAIANVAASPLLALGHVAICLDTGPEFIAGSTRLGAATAQKVALNMISTSLGYALGHVYDGRMVNLIADNIKLRGRAARIVADIAKVTLAQAEAALAEAQGAVKPAILIAKGASPAAAAQMLHDHQGHLTHFD